MVLQLCWYNAFFALCAHYLLFKSLAPPHPRLPKTLSTLFAKCIKTDQIRLQMSATLFHSFFSQHFGNFISFLSSWNLLLLPEKGNKEVLRNVGLLMRHDVGGKPRFFKFIVSVLVSGLTKNLEWIN
jgi:hypothetical protein